LPDVGIRPSERLLCITDLKKFVLLRRIWVATAGKPAR